MTQPEPAGRRQRLLRRAAESVALLVVAVVAIAVAIKATPMQTVNVAGQVVTVGTTAPSWSLSGPGGQPVRAEPSHHASLPRAAPPAAGPVPDQHQQRADELRPRRERGRCRAHAGQRLADGWKHYFAWETAIAGLGALVLLGAVAGWRQLPARTTIKLLAAGLLVTEAINVGAIIITASRAPGPAQTGELTESAGGQRTPAAGPRQGAAAAQGAGRGPGGLDRRGRGTPRRRQVLRPDPCLRPQPGLLRGGPGGRQRLAGAEPRLQCRLHRRWAAGPAVPERQAHSPATGRGAASHGRVCDHRQRRRQRRWLVPDGGLLRGRPSLR